MNTLKNLTVRCLPLVSEQLWVYLSVEILWQLLCGRAPFSLEGYLLSGILVVCANTLFLRRRRSLWAVLGLNLLLCLIWAPLLARTLDHTYTELLCLQIAQFLLPAIRGYHYGTRPLTIARLQSCGELMAMFCLFYLIVASFAPMLMFRIPLTVAVLVLDLLAVVLMRTTGRNTVQAGWQGSLAPAVLIFAALGAAAVAAGILLGRASDWMLRTGSRIVGMLGQLILAVWRFWQSLFKSRELTLTTDSTGQSFGDVEVVTQPVPASELMRRIMLGIVAVCVAAIVAVVLWSLLQWIWKNLRRTSWLGEDADAFSRSNLPRRSVLARLLGAVRVRMFLLRREGTPRAALLWLELWGAAHRCRRQPEETPREYLQRLRQVRLAAILPPAMQARYDCLLADIDGDLYGGGTPRLRNEEVRELLAAVKRSQDQTQKKDCLH